MGEDAKICDPGGGGLLLPLIADEQTWSKTGRAFIYFVALLWCFLGVSIVADIFMCAIEAVTSKRKPKTLSNGRTVAVKVWNDTVANLSLMALGSSAPEILLSVIELFSAEMYAGELGPSTIVGSAAFNLLVIIAVCVYVIPDGEKRTMKQPVVFAITAFFSVFAYLWLILILAILTPNLVTPAEGICSFLFFPVLLVFAYLADIGVVGGGKKDDQNLNLDEARESLALESGECLTADDLRTISNLGDDVHSRAHYKLKVTQTTTVAKPHETIQAKDLTVGFISSRYSFPEGETQVYLEVEKTGPAAYAALVKVDYAVYSQSNSLVCTGQMRIMPGQIRGELEAAVPRDLGGPGGGHEATPATSKSLDEGPFFWVCIVGATYHKPRESSLHDPHFAKAAQGLMENSKVVVPDDCCKAKVYSQKDGSVGSGQIRFEQTAVAHMPNQEEETVVRIPVQRFNGGAGQVKCHYRTVADSAREGNDFFATEGELEFSENAMDRTIEVRIAKRGKFEGRDQFFVMLSDCDDAKPVVVQDSAACIVTIQETDSNELAVAVARKLDHAINMDAFSEGNMLWKEQFVMALRPVQGDDDDAAVATVADWTIHFVALPWKLFFAFIPPPSYCGGWVCFCIALVFIGAVTAVIGDLAALMGCCMGLPDAITAITIVALGTSLPDTFASKVAAVEEPTADAAIGNVTGSNSVNVFLGLGLPWCIASIYWASAGQNDEWRAKYPTLVSEYPDGGFAVMAGDLVFSVIIFTGCSCIALFVICYRRRAFQAELGGPKGVKTNTALLFVLLWGFYVGLASWKVLNPDVAAGAQAVAVFVGIMCIGLGMVVLAGAINLCARHQESRRQSAKDHISQALLEHNSRIGRFQDIAMQVRTNGGMGSGDNLSQAVADLRQHVQSLDKVCASLEVAVSQQRGCKRGQASQASNSKDARQWPASQNSMYCVGEIEIEKE